MECQYLYMIQDQKGAKSYDKFVKEFLKNNDNTKGKHAV